MAVPGGTQRIAKIMDSVFLMVELLIHAGSLWTLVQFMVNLNHQKEQHVSNDLPSKNPTSLAKSHNIFPGEIP